MLIVNTILLPCSSAGNKSTRNAGIPCLIPGLGGSAGEGIGHPLQYSWASLVAVVKNPPASGNTGFDPWVGKIPWRREQLSTPMFWSGEFHGLYGPLTKSQTRLGNFHFSFSCVAEGTGNPLQCSCLENPRDRGAWWAAVYGVAQSQTRLKRLSSSMCYFEDKWTLC